jgi:hypothetical protein
MLQERGRIPVSDFDLDSPSQKATVLQASRELRLGGIIGFWVQLVLAIISGVVMLLAIIFLNIRTPGLSSGTPQAPNPGSGLGIFFALGGLVALLIGVYWFLRYIKLSNRLKANTPATRPTRPETLQCLQMGLMINVIGMVLIIVGAQAVVGTLFGKALFPQGAIAITNPRLLISAADVSVVQACINIIMAHFSGIIISLWLSNRIAR